jgi:hypothetical protein
MQGSGVLHHTMPTLQLSKHTHHECCMHMTCGSMTNCLPEHTWWQPLTPTTRLLEHKPESELQQQHLTMPKVPGSPPVCSGAGAVGWPTQIQSMSQRNKAPKGRHAALMTLATPDKAHPMGTARPIWMAAPVLFLLHHCPSTVQPVRHGKYHSVGRTRVCGSGRNTHGKMPHCIPVKPFGVTSNPMFTPPYYS